MGTAPKMAGSAKLKFIDLGTAQTFNVAAVFPNYKNLTVDNFVVYRVGTDNCGNATWHHIGGMNKSYDAATGVLTCNVILAEYDSATKPPSRYYYAPVGIKLVYV